MTCDVSGSCGRGGIRRQHFRQHSRQHGIVAITGYQPGGSPLTAFVQLDGLIPAASHLAGYVTFSDLPSPHDLTAGPFTFDQADTSR